MVITSAEVRGEEVLCQGLFLKKKTVKQTGRDSVFWNGWVARAWSSLHCLVYFPEGLKHFMIFFGGGGRAECEHSPPLHKLCSRVAHIWENHRVSTPRVHWISLTPGNPPS